MGKNDDFWEGVAVLFFGFLGLALISSALKPRCPQCNNVIEKGVVICPHCGTYLRWGKYDY